MTDEYEKRWAEYGRLLEDMSKLGPLPLKEAKRHINLSPCNGQLEEIRVRMYLIEQHVRDLARKDFDRKELVRRGYKISELNDQLDEARGLAEELRDADYDRQVDVWLDKYDGAGYQQFGKRVLPWEVDDE